MSTSYQISGAALHATRTILRHFRPRERGQYEATVRNIAIMIDGATLIFKLHQQLHQLVRVTTVETPMGPRASYLDKRSDEFAKNIEEIRHVIRLIELTDQQLKAQPVEPQQRGEWMVSGEARRAARLLFRHYEWERLPHGKYAPTENSMAHLIDCCTESFRLNLSLPALLRDSGWQTKEFSENFKALRQALEEIARIEQRASKIAPGIVVGKPLKDYKPVVQEPTAKQLAAMKPVAEAYNKARTVREATQVLTKAGIITARS